MQPLSILFGAGFTAAVAYSLGAVFLRRASSDPALRFVTGSALLSALVLLTGALNVVFPLTFLALGSAAIFVAGSEFGISTRNLPKFGRIWLVFVPFLALYLSNAMAPEISYDGSRYHLALVARILHEHGFHNQFRESLYAAFPQGVEMLYLFAFAFGRHSAASVVHLSFLLALTWQVYTWGRREGREVAAVCAAFLVFASPMLGVDGASALNDVAVAAICFALFNVLEQWSATRSPRLLAAAGLLAGFAMAGKYTAFVTIPYAVGYVAWKSRKIKTVAVVVAVSFAMIGPWLVRNWFWFQNPVAPFFNRYFPNPYFTNTFEREYIASQAIAVWKEAPLQLTVFGSLGGLFGPVFLLTPIALLALRWKEGRRLLLAATVFGISFFANTGTRFLVPSLAFVALALALALPSRICYGLIALHAVLSWPIVVRRYCHADAWRLDKITYREALRIKPEKGFLESNLPLYGVARMIERATPPGSVIFTEVPIPDAYTSREVRVAYQSAANTVSRRVWYTGFVPEHAPVWQVTFRFPPQTVPGIRIVQTATGATNWTVHEVQAYEGDRELPRSGWRADPAMTDGRLTSLWMSRDGLHPGQQISFAFSSPQRIDRVVIRTAMDEPEARYRLELPRMTQDPDYEQVAPPPDLRRQAAAELRRRGLDYLLAFDGQFGADDLRTRAADWGVRQIAEYKGARVYQLP